MASIFSRINVMNLWCDGGWRYAWRFILMPIGRGVDRSSELGYTSWTLFGFAFFWIHKLTPREEWRVRQNGMKIKRWAEKHGTKIK